MKKVLKFSVIIIMLVGAAVSTTYAQKFGYVNSAEILAGLPDVKQADSNLEALQKQLQKKYQMSVENYQKKLQSIQQRIQQGELSPKQQEEEAEKLKAEELELGQQQQELAGQLEEKRQSLLQPIYDKINTAIADVAKENGYQFIFEQGVLLYAEDTANVTNLVKAKLGIATP
jgi:outer membrane protein